MQNSSITSSTPSPSSSSSSSSSPPLPPSALQSELQECKNLASYIEPHSSSQTTYTFHLLGEYMPVVIIGLKSGSGVGFAYRIQEANRSEAQYELKTRIVTALDTRAKQAVEESVKSNPAFRRSMYSLLTIIHRTAKLVIDSLFSLLTLNSSGYSPDIFIDQTGIDKLTCAICTNVCDNPVGGECGHVFCRICLMKHQLTRQIESLSADCPTCRKPVSDVSIKTINAFVRQSIIEKAVRCVNPDCTAVLDCLGFDCRNMKEHRKICAFEHVLCHLCGIRLARCDLDAHQCDLCPMRLVECAVCREKLPYSHHAQHTDNAFKCKLSMECPNKCTSPAGAISIVRKYGLPDHERVCPLAIIKCCTCQFSSTRQDMPAHYLSAAVQQGHAELIARNMETFRSTMETLRQKSQQQDRVIASLQQTVERQEKELKKRPRAAEQSSVRPKLKKKCASKEPNAADQDIFSVGTWCAVLVEEAHDDYKWMLGIIRSCDHHNMYAVQEVTKNGDPLRRMWNEYVERIIPLCSDEESMSGTTYYDTGTLVIALWPSQTIQQLLPAKVISPPNARQRYYTIAFNHVAGREAIQKVAIKFVVAQSEIIVVG